LRKFDPRKQAAQFLRSFAPPGGWDTRPYVGCGAANKKAARAGGLLKATYVTT